MTLRIFDTATRSQREFVPVRPGHASIYLCGATPQSQPHIGHVRSGVAFDILRRWLLASGLDVAFVRNVTDIDDKILTKAAEHDRPWWEWVSTHERAFTWAYDQLNVLPPSVEPRATGHVTQMVTYMQRLIERGFAYEAAGSVYFDVAAWVAAEGSDYGSLSGNRVEEMEQGETDNAGKRSPQDFAQGKEDKGDFFMWYDWMAGGWGGRTDRDGSSATAPVFGPGLAVQPVEGQERLSPVITSHHTLITDSAGPGKYRGGLGVSKGGVLTDCADTVMSYCCDRSRSVTWGIEGGLPSIPQGVWLNRNSEDEQYLGALFSNVEVGPGDAFERPSAGGGGYGDPLERDPAEVLEDVIDGYVSVSRAAKDYGVVIRAIDPEIDEYELDDAATVELREEQRLSRVGKLSEDPEAVAQRYRNGELDQLDLIRHYGVILDWSTDELLPTTTQQFRAQLDKRTLAAWA